MKLNSVCSVYIWVSVFTLCGIFTSDWFIMCNDARLLIMSTSNRCFDLKIVHNVTLLIMR